MVRTRRTPDLPASLGNDAPPMASLETTATSDRMQEPPFHALEKVEEDIPLG
jgi:hypothetical protein